jgi:hypothetical protein
MRHYLIAGAATVLGFVVTSAAAHAQARGSAEASAAAHVNPRWTPPKTAWGHPDLEGIWTSDDMRGVPMSRPPQFGTRRHLTDEEFSQRARERSTAREVNDARTGTFRNEEGSRDFGYTSLVVDPPDGRVPALTAEARARRVVPGTNGVGPFDTLDDFNNYDRCITRGLAGSWLPVVYGNGARILQTPDAVIIAYEMVHDTRIIPLDPSTRSGSPRAESRGDGRARLGPDIKLWMGDSRGRWEGNTLVIETTNFTGRTSIGPNGGGVRHSAAMKMTERLTRIDPEMIDYELRVDDPKTYVQPWTLRMTLTTQPGYVIYEYGCHEGNRSVPNSLSAERAYEREAAENAAKGLPPPERVFERVNGADRGR